MVGGLVEQQHVGVGGQHLREQHAQLEAARERRRGSRCCSAGDAEALEDLGRARLERVAVLVRGSSPRARRSGRRRTARAAGPSSALLLLHRPPQLAAPHHRHVEDQLLLVGEVVLAQHADAGALGDRDRAVRGDLVAGEDAQEGRLARAVGADHAVDLLRVEVQRHAGEQRLLAVVLGEVGDGDHRRGRLCGWGAPGWTGGRRAGWRAENVTRARGAGIPAGPARAPAIIPLDARAVPPPRSGALAAPAAALAPGRRRGRAVAPDRVGRLALHAVLGALEPARPRWRPPFAALRHAHGSGRRRECRPRRGGARAARPRLRGRRVGRAAARRLSPQRRHARRLPARLSHGARLGGAAQPRGAGARRAGTQPPRLGAHGGARPARAAADLLLLRPGPAREAPGAPRGGARGAGARGARRRGRPLLRARRHLAARHRPRGDRQRARRRGAPGRQHADPAAGQEPVSHPRAHGLAQVARGGARAARRPALRQARDPRGLSQRDLPRAPRGRST